MTEYGHHISTAKPTSLFSHDPIKEKKEARRKILEAMWQRRRENNRRWYMKQRLQQDGEVI
jgi:DNA replication protein DnaC